MLICLCTSCGPREYKRYDCTISGTVHLSKDNPIPLANHFVLLHDLTYDETTYGVSYFNASYSQRTNSDGYFCFDIKSGGMYAKIDISCSYDPRADTIVDDYKGRYYDSIYFEYLVCEHQAWKKDVLSKMEDVNIYLKDQGRMQVYPLSFTNTDTVTIIVPDHETQIRYISIDSLNRYDSTHLYTPYKELLFSMQPEDMDVTTIRAVMAFPDSIQEGRYVLTVRCYKNIYSRIIELRNK